MKYFFGMIAFTLLSICSLQAQAVLQGRVVDAAGNGLTGANLFITETRQGAVADEQGNFSVSDLPAGTYALQASFVGYQSMVKTFTVQEGEPVVRLTIELANSSVDMSELVVKATRADARTPMTFTNLSTPAIEEQNLGQDIPYVLRYTPSAVVTSDAGAGIGYTGIRIRGTDPTRINITINGIPVNDAESQGVFWVNMPDFTSSVDDIQIQRGVGTSTNGAGAFGATINLNTSKVNENAFAELNATVGSFNTFKRNVQFSTGKINDRFVVDGRLSRITSDGYIDRASSDLDAYYLSGAYVGDKTMVRLNTFSGHEVTYQAWNGVPADLINDWDTRTFNSAGTEKPGEPYENEVDDYRQTHYQALLNSQLSDAWNLNLALHYTQGEGFFEQYKADQDLTAYGAMAAGVEGETPDLIRRLWLDNDFYGAVYGLNYKQDKVDFTLGGGYHIYEGDHFGEVVWSEYAFDFEPGQRYYENDARKVDFNVYGKLNYALTEKLNGYLDLQFRTVDYTFLGIDDDGSSVEQDDQLSFFNPKAGLFYSLTGNSSLYASFAVAQREPNRNDYVEANPGSRPDPEKLYNLETGYKKQWDKAAFEANAYYMYYRDQLVLNGQLNDVGAYTRVNVDKSYRLGIELSGGVELLHNLDFTGTATFSRNKIEAFERFIDVYEEDGGFSQRTENLEDTDLSFSPDVIAAAEISWEPLKKVSWFQNQKLNLSLSSKYVGKQYIGNGSDNVNTIDPYTFSDVRLQYQLPPILGQELNFRFLVQNLFNEKYETNAWSYRYCVGEQQFLDRGYYPQAGRNFLLAIQLKI